MLEFRENHVIFLDIRSINWVSKIANKQVAGLKQILLQQTQISFLYFSHILIFSDLFLNGGYPL